MSYLTVSQLLTRAGQSHVEGLLDMTGATLTTEVENIIDRQEDFIHAYIGGRYSTPLTADAGLGIAQEWTYALCMYDIYKRGVSNEVPEKIRVDYKDVVAQLKDVASGRLGIPGEDAPLGSNMGIFIESDDPHFVWGDDEAEGTY